MTLIDDRTTSAASRTVVTRPHDPIAAPAATRWRRKYARHVLLTDLFVVVWACAGAHLVAPQISSHAEMGGPFGARALVITAVIAALWMVGLAIAHSRDNVVVGIGTEEYKRVLNATFVMFAIVTMTTYLLDQDLPRSYLLVVMPFGILGLFVSRWCWRRWLHIRRQGGMDVARVLVVGTVDTVIDLVNDLERTPEAGYVVVGACVPAGVVGSRDVAVGSIPRELPDQTSIPIVGTLQQVPDSIRVIGADAVAVTPNPQFGPSAVRHLGWQLENTSTELILAPGLTDIAGPRIHTQPVAGLPLIHVEQPTYRGPTRVFKRVFDVIGSILLLLLLSPVFVAIGAAIKLSDGGPVFFRQERVGIDGSRFHMIKFRSMRVDAEAVLAELAARHSTTVRGAGNDTLFKMKDDPRVTRVGRFIRRFSLDELPQLINVVTGDMSLVGPRPPLPAEVATYEDGVHRRLLVRPGMTGLWQISGRSDLSWDESVRLDLYYVENWSVTGDLMILFKTAKAVFSSQGAY